MTNLIGQKLIVVAEDSPTQLEQLKLLLEKEGYNVLLRNNGKEALDIIHETKPDLVITDIVMPEIDGYELCNIIKNDDKLRHIPVLLLTTLDSPEDVKKGLLSMADDYLPKPLDEKLLYTHVTKILDNKNDVIKDELGDNISSGKVLNFLISTYETAIIKAKELEKIKNELSALNLILEKKVDERTVILKQRVKELNCLHEVSALHTSIDISTMELLQKTCTILKKSFTNPELTEIKIKLKDLEFQTVGYAPNLNEFSIPIKSSRSIIGSIDVVNTSKENNVPFLEEEKKMVDSVSQRVSEIYGLISKENEIVQLNIDLERKVEERTARLEDANKELESFSYSISHDLRAPLRAIIGYTNMLKEDYCNLFDGEGKKMVDSIIGSTSKLDQFIDDILRFSRVGRKELIVECVDMDALFREKYKELTQFEKNRKILFNIEGKLPAVESDKTLINVVVQNLLSNAIKYTSKKEEAWIKVKAEETEESVVFTVADNGAGFDEKYKEKLFEVFSRLHTDKEFPGTGIGLAISHRILLKHQGKIWAESNVGEGTMFFFMLPRKQGKSR